MNCKTVVSMLTTVLLATSLVFIGCGVLDDNNQPSIEAIPDKILDVGGRTTVNINITDADLDDTHTISASSDDTTVVAVSVRNTTLTITAVSAGRANITISATDDSGQDNATSTPIMFQVTVNEPPPPIDKGLCIVGMTLQPGESCSYGLKIVFSVRQDGTACRESELPVYREVFGINVRLGELCGNYDIDRDDYFDTNFSASKNPDGSWTIKRIPSFNIR